MQRSRISSSDTWRGAMPLFRAKSRITPPPPLDRLPPPPPPPPRWGRCRGRPPLLVVKAGPGLRAAPPHLAQHFAQRGAGGLVLVPAQVQAGQVAHREWPHREAEVVQHA